MSGASQQQAVGFPIQLDEATQTVTVAAGVPLRILLDYLSVFRHAPLPHLTVCPHIIITRGSCMTDRQEFGENAIAKRKYAFGFAALHT